MTRFILPVAALCLLLPALAAQSVTAGFALDVVIDPIAQGRSMVFAPDGRMFYTENATGRIMVIDDPTGTPSAPTEFATVSGLLAPSSDDMGLHGIALHPNFPSDPLESTNRFVYVVHAIGGAPQLVVKRFREDTANLGTAEAGTETSLIPSVDMGSAGENFGGRVVFDSLGNLYVTVGDGGASVSLAGGFAQDVTDRRGKVLRYAADGSVPLANPISGNAMYARGFRNPRGMAFNPNTLDLFGVDTGNPITSGVAELNVVTAGGNYGWDPSGTSGAQTNPDYTNPAWEFAPTFRPSSVAFYPPGSFGALAFPNVGYRNGIVYVGNEATTGSVHRLILHGANERRAVVQREFATGFSSPVRDVRFGPDGNMYVLTSGVLYRVRYIGNQSPNDPVANAGIDQTVDEGDVVTLNGSASSDPDAGTNLIFAWRQVGGSPVVTINNPSSMTPTFTAPQVNFDQTYTFELILEDGFGGVHNDFVIITVRDTGGDDGESLSFAPPGEGGCSTSSHSSAWWMLVLACVLMVALRRKGWRKQARFW